MNRELIDVLETGGLYGVIVVSTRNAGLKRFFHGSRDMSKQVCKIYMYLADGLLLCVYAGNS